MVAELEKERSHDMNYHTRLVLSHACQGRFDALEA